MERLWWEGGGVWVGRQYILLSKYSNVYLQQVSGLFPAILGKGPWPKLGENDQLKKLTAFEHNKGRNIYPQIQVILACIMPSITPKYKCLSIILIWDIVSHMQEWSLKKNNFSFFGKNGHGIGGKRWLFLYLEWGRDSAPRDGQKIHQVSL